MLDFKHLGSLGIFEYVRVRDLGGRVGVARFGRNKGSGFMAFGKDW